jgi:DNA-directed RNA polymerase specialized sigma24 family protein
MAAKRGMDGPHTRRLVVAEEAARDGRGGSWYGEPVAAADDETLFSALAVIRAAAPERRADRELSPAWKTVTAWLRHRVPGRDKEDLRQDALVKIVRHIDTCEARGAAGAATWLLRIARHTAIDASRTAKLSPVDRALRDRTDELDPLERMVATEEDAVSNEALGALAGELEEALDAALAIQHPSAIARIGPRAHGRARLYRRLLGLSVAEVKDRLGWHVPLTDDLVSKWIERGQVPLADAIRRWTEEDPDARGALGERLGEELGVRRHDAGKPRPARRSRPDGAGRRASVGPPPQRLVLRGIGRSSSGHIRPGLRSRKPLSGRGRVSQRPRKRGAR